MSEKEDQLRRTKRMKLDLEIRAKPEISIMDLPVVIFPKIFSYLDRPSLLHGASLVCKTWNQLAFDSSLWKTVSLKMLEEEGALEKALNKFFHAQNLTLKNERVSPSLIKKLSHLPRLHSLSLSWEHCVCGECENPSKIDPSLPMSINNEIEKDENQLKFEIPHLRTLKLTGFGFDNFNFNSLLINCSRLREVCLETSLILKNYNNKFCKILSNLHNSIFLTLSDSLECFSSDSCLDDKDLLNLNKCTKLTELELNSYRLTDRTLLNIINVHSLTELKLDGDFNFTRDGMNNMFDSGRLINITSLKLTGCFNLNDSHLKIISNRCEKLQILYLKWCIDISDTGITFITNRCSKLTRICIIECFKIRGRFMLEIKDNLKYLQSLELDQSLSKSKYVSSILVSLPTLKIVVPKQYSPSRNKVGLSCVDPWSFGKM